jgi:hypothetical protein
MDAGSASPDRNTVIAAREAIASSTVEDKDELLSRLLCQSYPLRVSQDC